MLKNAYPTPAPISAVEQAGEALARFLEPCRRLLIITGAGCSTESGIPDYRDAQGAWKRSPPITWQLFTCNPAARRRYWARNMRGWPHIAAARPGAAHRGVAALEARKRVQLLVTQNVDGLHEAAGSERVIDLHGRVDRVLCTACGVTQPRADFQSRLVSANGRWMEMSIEAAPDGDAHIEVASDAAFDDFHIPDCERCGGLLKPDVVFFGENVPRERVDQAFAALAQADALLVLGSSLMVYSGYRFAQAAAAAGLPMAAVNLGLTRADALLSLKLEQPVGATLSAALEQLRD